MAITNRDILHTNLKCAEFHEELSTDEKQNLINKLESYVSALHNEVRRDTSLAELHKAVDKHHAEFGIKYALARENRPIDTETAVQESSRKIKKRREELGPRKGQGRVISYGVDPSALQEHLGNMEEASSHPEGGTLVSESTTGF